MVRVQAAIVPAAIAGCFIVACLGVFATSNSADLSMLQPVLAYADSPGQAAPAQDNPAAAPQGTAADVPADCTLSSVYPESIRQWCALIMQSSSENNLDPNLVAAVMLQESGGNPLAYSHSGAVGLMQVMPRDGLAANFTCANGPCFSSRPTITELQDPAFNIAYGTRMLAGLIGKYGDLRDALRYYGPGNSGYSYADIVLRIFQRYQ